VAASRRQRALLRLVLVEAEDNVYLLRAARLGDSQARDTDAPGLRELAKRLRTESVERLLAEGPLADRYLVDPGVARRTCSSALDDADAEEEPSARFVSGHVVWLYRKICTTRALAEAYDRGEGGRPDGVVDVRFNVRLRNIQTASDQLVEALRKVEAASLEDRVRLRLRFWRHDVKRWLTALCGLLRRRKRITAKTSA